MSHVLSSINESMHACRRASSIPHDYLHALRTHKLSLRALQVHLKPPVSIRKAFISQEVDFDCAVEPSFQAPELSKHFEASAPRAPTYHPKHFPHLPSSHTYKATSSYTSRESDPRRIRERATEEGRMGEAALQKFVGAGSESHLRAREDKLLKRTRSLQSERYSAWREAMIADKEDATSHKSNTIDPSGSTTEIGDRTGTPSWWLDVGSIVNADQVFMRERVRTR